MAETREQLTWERDALAAGMDPAEVEKRRDLIEKLHETAENAIEAIEREREFISLLLEGTRFGDATTKVDLEEHVPAQRFGEFRDAVRRFPQADRARRTFAGATAH